MAAYASLLTATPSNFSWSVSIIYIYNVDYVGKIIKKIST